MDSAADIKLTVFGKTDVGLVREHNEDCFLIADATHDRREADPKEPLEIPVGPKGALLLVCDGMGGAAAGEVASQMAVESISTALAASEAQPRDAFARKLRRAIEDAMTASTPSHATTRASAAWAPPAPPSAWSTGPWCW